MSAIYISRRIRNIIMIGVVVISFIIGFSKSDLINAFLKPTDIMGQAPKEALNLFNESQYDTRIELKYITHEMEKIKRNIGDIIVENNLTEKYSHFSSDNSTWLIEIPRAKYKKVVQQLRNFDELKTDELIQKDNQILSDSIEERINDNKNRLEVLNEDYKNARTAYDQENYNRNIIKTERIIDSLKTVLRNHKKFTDNIFTMIDISRFISGVVRTEQAFKIFLRTFVISFLFFAATLFIIYFVAIIFLKLFTVLGIKTMHGKTSRYGRYGSAYGYGYDYGSRKKIKRKYIRKPRSEEGEHSDKSNDGDEK